MKNNQLVLAHDELDAIQVAVFCREAFSEDKSVLITIWKNDPAVEIIVQEFVCSNMAELLRISDCIVYCGQTLDIYKVPRLCAELVEALEESARLFDRR